MPKTIFEKWATAEWLGGKYTITSLINPTGKPLELKGWSIAYDIDAEGLNKLIRHKSTGKYYAVRLD